MADVANAVEGNTGRGITGSAGPETGGPSLKQPTFSSAAKDKYTELR